MESKMYEAEQSDVYTASDLVRKFDVTRRTIGRWIKEGKLPKPAIGTRWSRAQIDAILNPQTTSDRHFETSLDMGQVQ